MSALLLVFSMTLVFFLSACHPNPYPSSDGTVPAVTVETVEPEPDPEIPSGWSELTVSPASLRVGVGAELSYRLRATDPDGQRQTPTDVVWSVDDTAGAEIVDGRLYASAAGNYVVSASFEGGTASTTLAVDPAGSLSVQVVDRLSLEPVGGVSVQLGSDWFIGKTDPEGWLTVDGVDGAPMAISAWHEDYVSIALAQVVTRDVIIPIRSRSIPEPLSGEVAGTADLSFLDAGAAEIAVGFVGTSVPGSPWFLGWDQLVGPPRVLSVYGLEVELPANIVVADTAEDWRMSVDDGRLGVWSFGTTLPLTEALSAGSGNDDPIALLVDHLDTARWGMIEDITVPEEGTTEAGDLSIDAEMSPSVLATTGGYPGGTLGNERPLLIAYSQRRYGYIGTGIGAGIGSVELVGAQNLPPELVVGLIQEGGLGSGFGSSVAVASVVDGVAALPDWLDVPRLPTVYVESREIGLDTDSSAQLVVATIRDRNGHQRDLYLPAGTISAELPDIPAGLDRGKTSWDLHVVSLDHGTFDELLATEVIGRQLLGERAIGVSRVDGEVSGTAE